MLFANLAKIIFDMKLLSLCLLLGSPENLDFNTTVADYELPK